MNVSRVFILRPVATWLSAIALMLTGLLAYKLLPRAALPQVDYPNIQVVTRYPGASPEVMVLGVTAPLERQLGGMSGLAQMSSSSGPGTSIINLRFGLNVSLDVAEQSVQAAINAAAGFLPPGLPTPPVYNKVNPADAPILSLAVTSDSLRLTELEDLVETRVSQKISQVSGVGLVSVNGGQRPAVRVQVDATALAARGLGFSDVRAAIAAANSTQAKGNLDGTQVTHALESNGQIKGESEYRELVIAERGGRVVRLADVARVAEEAEDRNLGAWSNGKPAILLDVQRQPGANVVHVVEDIRRLLPELQAGLPGSVQVEVLVDRTRSIQSSLRDTQKELVIAVALVVLVIFLFLKKLSATLIPSLAVPLSLVGTFGVMYLAGFSLNNLTAMALTIATGFVVDDAIVMIENVARHIERGARPLEAALEGSKQIGFTIVSLTLSLLAVLIPLLFMGDIVGRLFREFAITLAVAILISAVVSLTFTPMLCARLFRREVEARSSTGGLLDRVIGIYGRSLDVALAWPRLGLTLVVGTALLTLGLAWWIPKGFFPTQDTGVVQGVTEAEQGVSFEAMKEHQRGLAELVARDPKVEHVASVVGIDSVNLSPNRGRLLVTLKPAEERPGISAQAIAERLRVGSHDQSDIALFAQPVQDLSVDDRISKGRYQYVVEAPDEDSLGRAVPLLTERLRSLPELANVTTNLANDGLAVRVDVDRDRAARLGISMQTVDDVLYDAFGSRFVSTIFTQTSQYRVILEMNPSVAQGIDALSTLHVRSAAGAEVPLSAVARIVEGNAPLVLHRERQFPAAMIAFDPAPSVSLGSAVAAVERARTSLELPSGVETRFHGAAQAFQSALRNELWLVLSALVTMYIVLGVLYESFIHPLTVLSTLPSAGIGALLALGATGTDLDVIAIIGIVLLIGIVQKNAILIIDFALEAARNEGKDSFAAIRSACLLRFRPILMTTLAALFSAIPLALGSGPGAELRRPLGVALIGGLLLSQVLTLFSTPIVYLAFERLRQRQTPIVSARTALPLGELET